MVVVKVWARSVCVSFYVDDGPHQRKETTRIVLNRLGLEDVSLWLKAKMICMQIS